MSRLLIKTNIEIDASQVENITFRYKGWNYAEFIHRNLFFTILFVMQIIQIQFFFFVISHSPISIAELTDEKFKYCQNNNKPDTKKKLCSTAFVWLKAPECGREFPELLIIRYDHNCDSRLLLCRTVYEGLVLGAGYTHRFMKYCSRLICVHLCCTTKCGNAVKVHNMCTFGTLERCGISFEILNEWVGEVKTSLLV